MLIDKLADTPGLLPGEIHPIMTARRPASGQLARPDQLLERLVINDRLTELICQDLPRLLISCVLPHLLIQS